MYDNFIYCLLTVEVYVLPLLVVSGGSHERRLLNDLSLNYNKLERPVAEESEALVIKFGLTLQQILDVVITVTYPFCFLFSSDYQILQDEKNQIITTNLWLNWVCKYRRFIRGLQFFFPLREDFRVEKKSL